MPNPTSNSTLTRPARTRISVSVLQGEIRTRFQNLPTIKALAEVLKSVGMYFGADYTVVHARLGVHLLSEEWCQDRETFDDAHRMLVTDAMVEAMESGNAKYHRIDGPNGWALSRPGRYTVRVIGAPIGLPDATTEGILRKP